MMTHADNAVKTVEHQCPVTPDNKIALQLNVDHPQMCISTYNRFRACDFAFDLMTLV